MAFGDLRSILHQPPSHDGWAALCAALEALSEADHEQATAYATQQLAPWPDALRQLPTHRLIPFLQDHPHPIHALTRALTLDRPPHPTLLALGSCAQLRPVRILHISALPSSRDGGDDPLFDATFAHAHLHTLRLERGDCGLAVARALSRAALDQLHTLALDDMAVSRDAARALSAARLPALTHLSLAGNHPARAGLASLLGWPSLPALTHLSLARCQLDRDLAPLLSAAPLPALTSIDLSDNPLGNLGLTRILDAPWRDQLQHLTLRGCGLTAEAMRTLAAAQLPALHTLDLSDNPIGDEGARHLLATSLPHTLRALRCSLSTDLHMRLNKP
jgi:hypothetical protein